MVYGHGYIGILLGLGIGFIASGVSLYFILKAVLSSRKSLTHGNPLPDHSRKGDKVDFIINSFSDLINRLKEKEAELERLRTEAEARASTAESYNEDILRSVNSGVITFNMDSEITTFNEAAERILKIKKTEILKKRCEEVFGADSTFSTLLHDALLTGKGIARKEMALRAKGTPRNLWVGLSLSPLKDKDGIQRGIIIVFTDLTEIRMLREQNEYRRRLAMLGEMSAGIAHELRNSMGIITGYAKLLSKKLKENKSTQETLSSIIQEIHSMDRIIKDLLNYGRPLKLSPGHVDLRTLLEKALSNVLDRLEDNPVRTHLRVDDSPVMHVDEVLLRQAVQNIIQNAIEAMLEGGELKIETQNYKGGVEVLISDTGPGIPEEEIEKIFFPFYSLKPGGTGMGLAFAHKIILAHGGSITVESKVGTGSTFRIYIPCQQSLL